MGRQRRDLAESALSAQTTDTRSTSGNGSSMTLRRLSIHALASRTLFDRSDWNRSGSIGAAFVWRATQGRRSMSPFKERVRRERMKGHVRPAMIPIGLDVPSRFSGQRIPPAHMSIPPIGNARCPQGAMRPLTVRCRSPCREWRCCCSISLHGRTDVPGPLGLARSCESERGPGPVLRIPSLLRCIGRHARHAIRPVMHVQKPHISNITRQLVNDLAFPAHHDISCPFAKTHRLLDRSIVDDHGIIRPSPLLKRMSLDLTTTSQEADPDDTSARIIFKNPSDMISGPGAFCAILDRQKFQQQDIVPGMGY